MKSFFNKCYIKVLLGFIAVVQDENVTSIFKIWTENFAWDPVMWRQIRKWLKWSPLKETNLGLDITVRKKNSDYTILNLPSLQWFIRHLQGQKTPLQYTLYEHISHLKNFIYACSGYKIIKVTASPISADMICSH